MCEKIAGKGAESVASDARLSDADRSLDSFPLLRTRFANRLITKCWPARFLISGSPAFRLVMFGTSISMLGSRISTVAFPMLVLHLNNSPLVAGLVAFAAIAPSMLVYVPAGVLVDRWNPRRVMLVSESLRGLTIASVVLALVLFSQHLNIWFLICAMVAEEILEIFSMLADRRYLNRVTEHDKVAQRQASIEVRTHAVVLAGRPVGPFLFVIAPFLPFLADAISFIASVASRLLMRRIDEPRPGTRRLPRKVVGDVRQGFGWLIQDRRARLTVLLMAITSMVAQALILMFLVLAHSRQFSTLAIGVVLAASGAGGAVGSFCSRFVLSAVRGFWLPIQMAAWSAALAFLALAGGQSAYWSAAAMFILGFTGAIGNIEFGTYLVRNVADDMIAKVTGIGQMLAIGACALGPVFGGYAIQRFQVQGAVGVLIIIAVVLAFVSFLIPEVSDQLRQALDSVKDAIVPARASLEADPATVAAVTTVNLANAVPELNPDDNPDVVPVSGAISLLEASSRP
jgi:MFS family permease